MKIILLISGYLCILQGSFFLFFYFREGGRREGTPDAMSLRFLDSSLRFVELIISNTSKCACVIHEFFLNLCFKFRWKICFNFFDIVAWEVFQRWEVFINYHKKCLIMTNKLVNKTFFTWIRKYLMKKILIEFNFIF